MTNGTSTDCLWAHQLYYNLYKYYNYLSVNACNNVANNYHPDSIKGYYFPVKVVWIHFLSGDSYFFALHGGVSEIYKLEFIRYPSLNIKFNVSR